MPRTTLAQRIAELPTFNAGRSISRDQVLELVQDAVVVEVNPDTHGRQPVSEAERLVWVILDTAWTVLTEGAVRLAIQAIRDGGAQAGFQVGTDAEIFREMESEGAGPTDYASLAPSSPTARVRLSRALDDLVHETGKDLLAAVAKAGTNGPEDAQG